MSLINASRRLPRFGLASVLLVVTYFAAWCAFHGNRARYERQVEREVLACGGTVDSIRREWSGGKVQEILPTAYERFMVGTFGQRYARHVSLSSADDDAALLDRVLRLPHLESLSLHSRRVDTEQLRLLGTARGLKSLYLSGTDVNDEALRALPRLRRLQYVDFQYTDVGDDTLMALSQLPNLQTVNVAHTKVTGAGVKNFAARESLKCFFAHDNPALGDELLKALASCSGLELIYLYQTNVSDEGMRHLRGHPQLTGVRVSRTLVTDKSLEIFASMPRLKFLEIQPHWPYGVAPHALQKFSKSRPDVKVYTPPQEQGEFPSGPYDT